MFGIAEEGPRRSCREVGPDVVAAMMIEGCGRALLGPGSGRRLGLVWHDVAFGRWPRHNDVHHEGCRWFERKKTDSTPHPPPQSRPVLVAQPNDGETVPEARSIGSPPSQNLSRLTVGG